MALSTEGVTININAIMGQKLKIKPRQGGNKIAPNQAPIFWPDHRFAGYSKGFEAKYMVVDTPNPDGSDTLRIARNVGG